MNSYELGKIKEEFYLKASIVGKTKCDEDGCRYCIDIKNHLHSAYYSFELEIEEDFDINEFDKNGKYIGHKYDYLQNENDSFEVHLKWRNLDVVTTFKSCLEEVRMYQDLTRRIERLENHIL